MAEIYRQRHPEHTVFYRVFFYYFEKFLREYEDRFEKEHGYFRPVIQDVVEKYLDCGNPMCGFTRIRCQDCGEERLLMFSCKTSGFCPSCHAKRREEWGEWKILRWRYTGFNVRSQVRALTKSEAERIGKYMIRYYGLCSNAHRGKMRKAGTQLSHPPIIEDDPSYVPSKGWTELIRKVYEVDPLICPSCRGRMSIISFIEEPKTIDRIIGHLNITFQAGRPPVPCNSPGAPDGSRGEGGVFLRTSVAVFY